MPRAGIRTHVLPRESLKSLTETVLKAHVIGAGGHATRDVHSDGKRHTVAQGAAQL